MNKNLNQLFNYLLEKNIDKKDIQIYFDNINKEIIDKKYGLVWEEQKENLLENLKVNFPTLIELENKKIIKNKGKQHHLLLEGDNLESLYLLNYTHKKRIDAIIIDPPYNRGKNDFVYNDKIVDTEDIWRHSKWLSFMDKRLRLAYELLKDEGFICINIDDHEFAQLKLLCDEIFREENFISCIPRRTKSSGKTTNKVSLNHDYILMYAKDVNKVEIDGFEHTDKGYKHKDEYFDERGYYKLNQTLDYDSLQYSPSLDYPLEIEGVTYYAGTSYENYLERKNGSYKRADWAWRWSPKLFKFGYDNGFVVVKKNRNGGTRIYTKTYQNVKIEEVEGKYVIEEIERKIPLSTLDFMESTYSNDNAKKDLKRILPDVEFDYPKPVSLIKKLIQLIPNKEAIILDFFAGSGTTGQAVMELNDEDKGSRTFILCTNNELKEDIEIDFFVKNKMFVESPPKRQRNAYKEWKEKFKEFKISKEYKDIVDTNEEYHNLGICRAVTYQRLSKLINGFKAGKKQIKGMDENLNFYKVKLAEDKGDILDNAQNLINKCDEIISIKEGCYEVLEKANGYNIVSDGEKVVLIYRNLFAMDYHLDEIVDIINKYDGMEKIIYTTNSSYNNSDIIFKEYPQEIIDLYNKLRKTI